jgi:type IV secretory pathway VirB3-like protein
MKTYEGMGWDPAFLGPLDEQFAPVTGAVRCFAGEERYLSPRKIAARAKLWAAIRPHLERVLDADETVLHVAPAVHNPRLVEIFGFGVWYVLFFRAALVLTDRRLVEVMLRKPDRADTCVRSYSWGQVKGLKLKWGGLTLKSAQGRTQKWAISERGDRKLLALLLPKIAEQLLPGDIQTPRPVPLWHCPQCGSASAERPSACHHCGVRFRSRGMAAALSLAFPGAGLLYAGHPVLAALDFLGEAAIFLLVAALFLLAGNPADLAVAFTFGLLALLFTKLESAHVASVLVQRTRPERDSSRWRAAAIAGAVLSLVLIAGPPLLSGAFANLPDRDLDLSANELGWSGGRNPASWRFGVDAGQRSEWIRDDGQRLFVFARPLAADESFEEVVTALRAEYGEAAVPRTVGGFETLRIVEPRVDSEGGELPWVRWLLYDGEHHDLHTLEAPVFDGDVASLEADLDELLRTADWVSAGS